jgi:hypothetical protein
MIRRRFVPAPDFSSLDSPVSWDSARRFTFRLGMGRHLGWQGKRTDRGPDVNLLKQLQNPYALVLQGFLVGGLLFWTAQGHAAPQPVVHAASIIATN